MTVWREENNFRIEVVSGFVVIFFIIFYHFSFIEAGLCVVAITIILSAEIVNTAVEDLCNKIEPKHDKIIAKIKDTIGTSVLVSIAGAIDLGVLVFYHHFI